MNFSRLIFWAKMCQYLQTIMCQFCLWIIYILGNIRIAWHIVWRLDIVQNLCKFFLYDFAGPYCANPQTKICCFFLWILEQFGTLRLDIFQNLCKFCQFSLGPKCANTLRPKFVDTSRPKCVDFFVNNIYIGHISTFWHRKL